MQGVQAGLASGRVASPQMPDYSAQVIDDRFSAAAFAALTSPADRISLERELQEVIEAEIASAVSRIVADVASQLNDLGHDLKPTDDPECYEDGASASDFLRLRVCITPTATVMWRGGAV